ncbi:glycerophosphodiester phosphodiesterase [Actinoplanes derwentensis]|uniref:Glycerophosphoryl diester phosphodiesterase n=1 Tax=Actinoplanes derwentensis TaxID=113562 RepID=A0A1H2D8C9_9ACTN|nr:glycerophosphodiester phosphodiesterase [Actinoplanes derwentensis]GID89367.1 glycerophosphoryl diester phosphodiesterase [Actinoplanes derwentensis]SDT78516.1 glycerophosphoryl diester phosphodiesterase [Actinoplanes derwentensis]
MPHPFLDAPAPLAFAHRGGAADGDENTAAAFGRAVAMGYRHIETDVHASADGVPVVIHDPGLQRMTGLDARVADLTWADLSTVRIAGESLLPRLDEVLDAWPSTRFNIEVKADAVVTPALEAVRRTGAGDRVLLGSFNDARLARVRALGGPRIATSLGQRAVARLWAAAIAGLPLRLPPSAVAAQIPVRHGPVTVLTARFLAYLHRLGLAVHIWTVDDPAEIERLIDMGVDGIMTDRIEILRDVYAARGLWIA